jgi:hypothetical protein|tara:strand:+ start:221 stop:445 length:225 start_codon:yes stop_codon:yes gene_type:complete
MENCGLYVDMPMSFRITTGVEIVEEEVISFIDPSSGALEIEPEKLNGFLKYVERYYRNLKSSYFEPIMDGVQWE